MAKVATDASSGSNAACCRGVSPQADAQQDAQAPEEILDIYMAWQATEPIPYTSVSPEDNVTTLR
eukprot:11689492-Alexandrium_andersonii.AAC.1